MHTMWRSVVLLIFTLSLGLVFGTIFSFTDVERFWKSIWHLFYAAHVIERRYCAPIGTMIGMTGGLIFMAIRCEEVDNIEKKYQKEGQKKKFRFQDGDLGVIKYDASKEKDEEGDIQTDSSDEEALLL